jgi:hypothetical protein
MTDTRVHLDVREYEGRTGDPAHITRSERGPLPTSAAAAMRGAKGEVPGAHANRVPNDMEHDS